MAVKYRIEGSVRVSDLERLDVEGWSLREVLNSRPVDDGSIVMVVLLSKSIPENVSGLWKDSKPTPPKPVGKPRTTQGRKAA